eukprot:s614_g20.t1
MIFLLVLKEPVWACRRLVSAAWPEDERVARAEVYFQLDGVVHPERPEYYNGRSMQGAAQTPDSDDEMSQRLRHADPVDKVRHWWGNYGQLDALCAGDDGLSACLHSEHCLDHRPAACIASTSCPSSGWLFQRPSLVNIDRTSSRAGSFRSMLTCTRSRDSSLCTWHKAG